MNKSRKLSEIKILNILTSNLPADKIKGGTPRQVRNACFSFCEIESFPQTRLVSLSQSALAELDLSLEDPSFLESIFKDRTNIIRNSDNSYSLCYAGHQFGNWAGQLGDGRATTFGEIETFSGNLIDIQVKGGGLTPYSRFADGKAVLRSSIREFLASEAMMALGIRTTRALAVFESGESVKRDKVYNGNVKNEPGALCIRTAPSFIRFGNFEMMKAQNQELLETLFDFEIKRNFQETLQKIIDESTEEMVKKIDLSSLDRFQNSILSNFISQNRKEIYKKTLIKISELTAEMVVGWESVGFVHGVMNTDNMSVLGLTIDYGPYGFMDFFDRKYTPNLSDHPGRRYSYQNQSGICVWNLSKLLSCFVGSIGNPEDLMNILQKGFLDTFDRLKREKFFNKLGLEQGDLKADLEFLDGLMELLNLLELDFTRFFVCLEEGFDYELTDDLQYADENFLVKFSKYIMIRCFDFREKNLELDKVLENLQNQKKNYKHGLSIEEIVLESEFNKLVPIILKENELKVEKLVIFLKDYINRLDNKKIQNKERKKNMRNHNPFYILRNFSLEEAIDAAESGDYNLVNVFLEIIQNPYQRHEKGKYLDRRRPSQVEGKFGAMFLSCSS